MYRQGDVLLVPATLPADAVERQAKGDVILAYGEVTGHAHRIKEREKVQNFSSALHQKGLLITAIPFNAAFFKKAL